MKASEINEGTIHTALLAGIISDRLAEKALAVLRGCCSADEGDAVLELVAEIMSDSRFNFPGTPGIYPG